MRVVFIALMLIVAGCGGSGGSGVAAVPPCDQACTDKIAARGIREMMKVAYNGTLQGKPVGTQDETRPCLFGGTVHVTGSATSNASQGSTEVDLTYTFDQCGYLEKDTEPNQNYRLTLTGSITQKGTLAVQPSSTIALSMSSESLTIAGTVHDPPLPYDATCALLFGQNGNKLNGQLCTRDFGVDL